MDERLIRAQFNKLSEPEKAEIMKSLAKRYQMNFKEISNFSRWRRSSATGIFEKDGAEFVFVPGDAVSLGWASFSEGLTEESAEELREVYEEFEFEGTYEEFLGSFMTPVRDVTIPPMLVEREPQEPCWEDLTLDDPRLKAHPEWLKQLEDAIRNYPPFNGYCSGPIRFTKLKTAIVRNSTMTLHILNCWKISQGRATRSRPLTSGRIFAEVAAERCFRGETAYVTVCICGILTTVMTTPRMIWSSRTSSE